MNLSNRITGSPYPSTIRYFPSGRTNTSQPQGDLSFEDMMARYKTQSEEKIADLKRVTENHRGGYSRRRG